MKRKATVLFYFLKLNGIIKIPHVSFDVNWQKMSGMVFSSGATTYIVSSVASWMVRMIQLTCSSNLVTFKINIQFCGCKKPPTSRVMHDTETCEVSQWLKLGRSRKALDYVPKYSARLNLVITKSINFKPYVKFANFLSSKSCTDYTDDFGWQGSSCVRL